MGHAGTRTRLSDSRSDRPDPLVTRGGDRSLQAGDRGRGPGEGAGEGALDADVVGRLTGGGGFEAAPGLRVAGDVGEVDGDVVAAGGEGHRDDEAGAREHLPRAGVGLAGGLEE